MKTWLIAFGLLLLPGLTMAQCGVEVQQDGSTVPYQPSSPTIRITILRDGKPFVGAKVYISEYMDGEHPVSSVSAGDDGVAALPKLTPGHHYHVLAPGISETHG